MANIKELAKQEEKLSAGHRACSGCTAPMVVRMLYMAAGDTPLVIGCATGCLEVTTTIFPNTSWKTSFIHSAFENSAATVSGVEAAYKSLKKQGRYDRDVRFVAFGGDGGTYDIGFQSLSGAMERGHNMVYVCYNNEAYMNTGVQRSSATPKFGETTTSPVGSVEPGKKQFPKDLTEIMVAHSIPYVAQASPSMWNDLITKFQKALNCGGPAFVNVLSPCRLGWAFPSEKAVSIGRDAVNTCVWPLYEVVDGQYKITYKPREKKPVDEYLKQQTRYRHLFRPGGEAALAEIQANVDSKWERLKRLAGEA
ncbi:MAG: pyruvate ferredoxin oxidoreductase [Armatimonadetes bacterium]|nr:pyruvate ferredoxin oxidoreductase [Armatimonadota bacterium]